MEFSSRCINIFPTLHDGSISRTTSTKESPLRTTDTTHKLVTPHDDEFDDDNRSSGNNDRHRSVPIQLPQGVLIDLITFVGNSAIASSANKRIDLFAYVTKSTDDVFESVQQIRKVYQDDNYLAIIVFLLENTSIRYQDANQQTVSGD